MTMTRWLGGLATTAATAGLLLAGGGTAFADGTPPTPVPVPTQQNSGQKDSVCAVRIPNALARIDKLTARINGNATTRGSTAWLQARSDQARTSGYPALADLLADRVSNRQARLTELANLKSELQTVQSKDCAS
ncbi:hypothetical protein [Pseudonocardia sp. GCM10023141]|uniref:hypothetical protein n=1 Tax=Pseudonocardia sp. GCM10023141 TaxID=3252653 RepID=UPI003612A4BC